MSFSFVLNVIDAVKKGDLAKLNELHYPSADYSICSQNQRTLLMIALNNNHTHVVRWLLLHGADVEQQDESGFTALHYACEKGNVAAVKMLLACGANVQADAGIGWTPLHEAVWENKQSVVKLLIKASALIDVKDEDGNTPLHLAAMKGLLSSTIMLLNAGCDIDATNHLGDTPLHLASVNQHEVIISVLLKRDAKVAIKNKAGNTALMCTVLTGNLMIIRLLLEKSANVNETNLKMQTPLMKLMISKHLNVVTINSIITLFAAHEANLFLKDSDDWTALHYAALLQQAPVIEHLCQQYQISESMIENIRLQRKISVVFGDERVFKLLHDHLGVNYNSGGYVTEAVQLVKDFLGDFIKSQIDDKKIARKIGHIMSIIGNYASSEELLANNDIFSGKRTVLTSSGYKNHSLYVTITKSDETNHQLVLVDRGLWRVDKQDGSDQIYPFRKLLIENNGLPQIIQHLHEAKNSKLSEADHLLFNEIPKAANSKYKLVNIKQSAFKSESCFFDNLKSVVLSLFMTHFGFKEGRMLYKRFDLFMHEKQLEFYRENSTDPFKILLISLCKKIINEKSHIKHAVVKRSLLKSDAHVSKRMRSC